MLFEVLHIRVGLLTGGWQTDTSQNIEVNNYQEEK